MNVKRLESIVELAYTLGGRENAREMLAKYDEQDVRNLYRTLGFNIANASKEYMITCILSKMVHIATGLKERAVGE